MTDFFFGGVNYSFKCTNTIRDHKNKVGLKRLLQRSIICNVFGGLKRSLVTDSRIFHEKAFYDTVLLVLFKYGLSQYDNTVHCLFDKLYLYLMTKSCESIS